MGDNDTMTCPIQSFSSAEFSSSNSNLYSSENQNSLQQNDEKKDVFGTKEDSSGHLNFQNSPVTLPKRFEENPDSQDCLTNTDLPNGHNNPDAINIAPRGKSLGELLQESEDLPDTVLIGEYSSKEKVPEDNSEKGSESKDQVDPVEQENSNIASQNSQENSEQEKTPEDSVSQDFFDERKDEASSNEKNEQCSNQDTEFSEGFDLHLSETQSFLPTTEKGRENQIVSESEEESQSAVEAGKTTEGVSEPTEDVEMSNGSSSNHDASDSNKESNQENANSNEASEADNIEAEKSESTKEVDSEESLSNGEVRETKEEEEEKEKEKSDEVEEADSTEAKLDIGEVCKVSSDENNTTNELEESKTDKEEVEEKADDQPEESIAEAMEVESTKDDEKPQLEVTRVSSRQRQRKQMKEEQKKEDEASKEDKPEAMEVQSSTNEPTSEAEEPVLCTCEPGCHKRIITVSRHLNNACSQLDEFIKLKRREENKLLKSFLDMLKEINDISDNKAVKGVTKISEHILIPMQEEAQSKRKASKRKSNDLDTPLKETPRKRAAEDKGGKKSTEKEKKSSEDFKDVKGLAVFAKWPNSGWYYPGKVEELSGADWKEASNVTVKFYDGLVRELKNIHILPAHLIPDGSLLCDLEDETEMTVLSCDGSNQNSVDFKLSTKDSSDPIEMNFNKLAIRANHMKFIKQQLEPTTDAPKKMHLVSLDNLVSGRRSRGRSKKDDSDTEEKTSNQTERRSRTASSATPAKKASTPRRARN